MSPETSQTRQNLKIAVEKVPIIHAEISETQDSATALHQKSTRQNSLQGLMQYNNEQFGEGNTKELQHLMLMLELLILMRF